MKKITIEITEDNLCKIVKEYDDGSKSNAYTYYNELLNTLNSCTDNSYSCDRKDNNVIYSPIFPCDDKVHLLMTKTMIETDAVWYILVREASTFNRIEYYDEVYHNVGMPKLIFALKEYKDRCVYVKIAAIKNEEINYNTSLYKYPLSNVFDNFSVCLGSNKLNNFDLKGITNLKYIPDMFLSMRNNDDKYINSNMSNLSYEDLLKSLENNVFDESYLIKTDYNLNKFIEELR